MIEIDYGAARFVLGVLFVFVVVFGWILSVAHPR
jgi:hypothetical protein